MSQQAPKVSVCMVTYNQERYIAQAVDSVLMQETSFPFELVIGEDCSTDNTRAIVQDYQRRYPDKIKLLLPEKNQGAARNVANTLKNCQGEYIAFLEGDDYWTKPYKLQKQADYLDQHPECSACFHSYILHREDSILLDGEAVTEYFAPTGKKPFYTLEDTLPRVISHTTTVMFRGFLLGNLPDWVTQHLMGDYIFQILNAQHGLLGYIDEDMSVYRAHMGGIWSGINTLKQRKAVADVHEEIDRYLDHRYSHLVRPTEHLLRVASLCVETNIPMARDYVNRAIRSYRWDKRISFMKLVRVALQAYVPPVYSTALTIKRALVRE